MDDLGGGPEEDGTPHSRRSSADPFGDDEVMGGLLKSLISAQGLQAAWMKVAKRLQAAEQGLKRAQEKLEAMPVEYVSREEWTETVLRKHTRDLEDHGAAIGFLKGSMLDMHDVATKEQRKLQDNLIRTRAIEEWQEEARPLVRDVKERAEELQKKVESRLDAAMKDVNEHTATSNQELDRLRTIVQERLDVMYSELEGLEIKMKEFTRGETTRAIDAMMTNSEDNTPTSIQKALLRLINQNLVDPVRTDLVKAGDRIDRCFLEMERQKEDMSRQIIKAERSALEVGAKMNKTALDLKEDIDTRARRVDVSTMELVLSKGIKDITDYTKTMHSKVVIKFNEFVDHFAKLQDCLEDHEHCLRHHAEEIENRGTKYDVLLCQNQIDKCARKEEFTRETQDMRKVMQWQSSKIETFGLVASGLSAGRRKVNRRRNNSRLQQNKLGSGTSLSGASTPLLRGASFTSRSRAGSSASLCESGNGEDETGDTPTRATGRELYAVEDAGETEASATTENQDVDVLRDEDLDEAPLDDGEGAFGAAESESEAGMSGSSLIRQQLEAIAMGLVGLAFLSLREPKLGMGRDARLRQEKEMLDELQNLRHWITNRIAPAGWDPAKITTVALACSHPRSDELKRPLPQVSLKGMLDHKRQPPADLFPGIIGAGSGGGSARVNMTTGSSMSDRYLKPPLTARSSTGGHQHHHHGSGGAVLSLPPLNGMPALVAA